jgi:hypothetical protein
LVVDDGADLFHGFSKSERTRVWMSHGDQMTNCPKGWTILAHSDNSPIAAFADPARRLFGLQFHPEVVHSARGREVLDNFTVRSCGCQADWTMEHLSIARGKKSAAKWRRAGVARSAAARIPRSQRPWCTARSKNVDLRVCQ